MKRFKTTHFRILGMIVLIAGLTLTSCTDSSVSSFDVDDKKANAYLSAMSGTIINANSTGAGIIIDSFDQGPQVVIGNGNGVSDVYSGSGPIGGLRELFGQENHPVTSKHTISGTAPGESRITWSGNNGATIQELRYGSCIDPNQTRSDRVAVFLHALAECTNPNSSELNADFSGMGGIDIDFVSLLGGADPNTWRVVVVLQTGNGGTYRYDNASVPYQQGSFTLSIPFSEFSSAPSAADLSDVDGIAISMGNNGNFSTSKDIAISEIRAVAGSGTQANVFQSGTHIQSWAPIFPVPQFGHWPSQACTIEPAVGPDANWVDPRNAFAVGETRYLPELMHQWELIEGWDWDAQWINSYNSINAKDAFPGALDSQQSFSKYSTEVSGEGDFVVQFLADNCSWIYLDGNLIGFQDTNWNSPSGNFGRYPVTLTGNHELTYIIFDGGGLLGGKFRLETTQSFIDNGGNEDTIKEPVTLNSPPVADAGTDETVEATGLTTSVTLDGSGSSDPDGDTLTFSWSAGGSEIATGANPTVSLGLGTHVITLTVDDGNGGEASDEVTITVEDTTAPVLSFSLVTGNLWPPNHKMVLVVTGISASDIVDGTTGVTVTVSSSEAANGRGDGNTDTDYEVVTKSDGSKDVYVRSERSGKGNSGRTYTISMTTTDVAGNSSSDSLEVKVAQNQGRGR